jgi:general secretion pathway protein D
VPWSKLDQPPARRQRASGNIHVVYLKNADATKLAATLRAAMAAAGSANARAPAPARIHRQHQRNSAGQRAKQHRRQHSTSSANSGLGPGASNSAAPANQPSTGGQIQADPATNSLIITAPEPQYRQLRAVIDKLDGRRAQVLVESLIVEVNANKLAEFGIQWQGVLGKQGDGTIGVIGTNSALRRQHPGHHVRAGLGSRHRHGTSGHPGRRA